MIVAFYCYGQDSMRIKKPWQMSGYLKELVWIRAKKGFNPAYATSLVHNRLQLKWIHSTKLTGRIEIRNRLYWGSDVKKIPDFRSQLKNSGEAVNLSLSSVQQPSLIQYSSIERLWLAFQKNKWNLRWGRQRINWGVTNCWNPNDIFNSYNFLDFDYEERSGSDAVKAKYLINDRSSIEVAAAVAGKKPIAAFRYFTNFKKIDLQWIVGSSLQHFTTGIGWAANIKDAGIKGEIQLYADRNNHEPKVLATVETDYLFKGDWYLSMALLFNDKGLSHSLNEGEHLSFQPTARNLMPTRYTFFLNSNKVFTPRLRGSMSLAFSPGPALLIFFPSLDYELRSDLDLTLICQSFFVKSPRFESISNIAFIRLKWSF